MSDKSGAPTNRPNLCVVIKSTHEYKMNFLTPLALDTDPVTDMIVWSCVILVLGRGVFGSFTTASVT